MKEDVSEMIYGAVSGTVDLYPVVADVEETSRLPLPYAVYRLKETPERTKERRRRRWSVGFFVVSGAYSECQDVMRAIEERMEVAGGDEVSVRGTGCEVKYDGEDRVYIGELNVDIEEL